MAKTNDVRTWFLSRSGRVRANKILNFMSTLIIYVSSEASEEETKATYLDWITYKHAIEKSDDIYHYQYNGLDCRAAGISEGIIRAKNLTDRDVCFKLCVDKDPHALLLLDYLRKQYISNYVEENSYYSQFQGVPRKGQEIYIRNRDEEGGENVLIQDVKLTNYPKTYQYLYVDNNIETIIKDHPDYYYLRFLRSPISIYKIRSCEEYDIISYDSTFFSEQEMSNFFECYNKSKIYIREICYTKGFKSRMPQYPFIMEVLLLQLVFTSFFNSFMNDYALANYTDQEIYDILDSYHLSNLKKINIATLRKIIRDIPDLIELKGSDEVITRILDIVADTSVTVKRYYLIKTYNVGANGETRFDLNKSYEQNVDIAFEQKIIRKGNGDNVAYVQDYDTFVEEDDTWGGDCGSLSDEEKAKVKNEFRRDLLKTDFTRILTKYITISSTIDTYKLKIKLHNLLGLLWQWLQRNGGNFLVNKQLIFRGMNVRGIDAYAALCWMTGVLNGIDEPDKIHTYPMNIYKVMTLQENGLENYIYKVTGNGKPEDPDYVEPYQIKLPSGLGDYTIEKILGAHDDSNVNDNTEDSEWPYYYNEQGEKLINYQSVFVKFSGSSTLSSIFSQYNKNAAILDALKTKIMKSAKLDECKAWEALYEMNLTNTYFNILFQDGDSYLNFIKDNSRDFYEYLRVQMGEKFEYDRFFSDTIDLFAAFKEFILEQTENQIVLSVPDSDSATASTEAEYLNDLKLMFNEFLSIYSELHKIEYTQTLSDEPYNKLKLLFAYDKEVLSTSDNIKIDINDNIIKSDKHDYFEYIMQDKYKATHIENIIKSIEKEKKSNIQGEMILNDLAEYNITQFIMDELENIETIRINSTSKELSQEYKDLKATLEQMKEYIIDNRGNVSYNNIYNITNGEFTGKKVLISYWDDELKRLNADLERIKSIPNILPKLEYYITDSLSEDYRETIRIIWRLLDIPVREELLIDDKIDSDELKLVLKEYIDKFIDIKYDLYQMRIKLDFDYKEDDISYTDWYKEYTILKYLGCEELMTTEYVEKVSLKDMIASDLIVDEKSDKLNMTDNLKSA